MSAGNDPSFDEYGEQDGGSGLPEFLFDPIGVVQRRWIPAALFLGVGIAATIVAGALWKPVFQASSTILITSQKISTTLVTPSVQDESLANINAMLGEVLSAENLSGLIDKLELFPDRKAETPRIDLVAAMRARISAAPQSAQIGGYGQPQSIVYQISYKSKDRDEAAAVTNALAALFVDVSVKRRNNQAQRATVFLRSAAERAETELREQSRLVSEFRRAHRGELPDEQSTSFQRLEILSARRDSLSEQIGMKEDRILSLTSQGGEASETQIQLNELRRELARQIAIHTEEHPNVMALRDRIDRLGEAKTPGVSDVVLDDERRQLARLREQLAQVDADITSLDQRVDRIPHVAEQLSALEQKEKVLSEDYTAAMRKLEQAELAENAESAQQGGQVSILDPAVAPSSPQVARSMVVLIGLLVSVGMAAGIALLLELIDPVVIHSRQIQKLSGRPVLGTVPHVA
jgi:succinoglycan biosynthesis transport protein ExoP